MAERVSFPRSTPSFWHLLTLPNSDCKKQEGESSRPSLSHKDIRFLQVRHEETGALAAVMQAKFGGSIGVAVGSGGPGATQISVKIFFYLFL